MSDDSKESQLLKHYFSLFDIPADYRIQALRAWEREAKSCVYPDEYTEKHSNVINLFY